MGISKNSNFQMDETMLTETIKGRIAELKEYTFIGDDPRRWGDHPHCMEVADAISAEMDKWSDKKIKAFEATLNEEASELLYSVFWELANTRAYLCPKYSGGWFPPQS